MLLNYGAGLSKLCSNWLLEKCQVRFCFAWAKGSQYQPRDRESGCLSQAREWGQNADLKAEVCPGNFRAHG